MYQFYEMNYKAFPMMENLDLASEVTTTKIYNWKQNKRKSIKLLKL